MNTRDEILAELTGSNFNGFANGIDNTRTYFRETGYDEVLFQHALTVFTYHLDHNHEEITKAFEKLGDNFMMFKIVLEANEAVNNMFTEGQIEGFFTFISNYRNFKLDLTGYILVTGFTYQIVASSCKNILKLIDKSEYPDEYEGIETFSTVFDRLWQIQMTVQNIISNTSAWDDYYAVHLFNKTLSRADLESQSRMMAGLSSHENNSDIQKDIVNKYIGSLDVEIKRAEQKKKQLAEMKKQINKWFPA